MANKQSYLGEFEHVVLLTILSLKDNAYGVSIRQQLKTSIARDVSIGAIYTTADRLEKKGLIMSTKGEATPERGGKAKRYFTVTALGKNELGRIKKDLHILWNNCAHSRCAIGA